MRRIPQQHRANGAERTYAANLKRVAQHVGMIIGAYPPADITKIHSLRLQLAKYAELLTPWAENAAAKMIEACNVRDKLNWSGLDISPAMMRQLLNTDIGSDMRYNLARQVDLIKSLPLEAAQRVQDLTIKALENSTRADEIKKEIMRSGEVTQSRAVLIARTEVARTSSVLNQARAENVGSEGYIWRTSRDGDVRPSHRQMANVFVKWTDPPTLDGMTGHAGCLPNCRCWSEVILPD